MYRCPFFTKQIILLLFYIVVIIYNVIFYNEFLIVLTVGFSFYLAKYIEDLRYFIKDDLFVKQTGKMFKREKMVKISNIVTITVYSFFDILILETVTGKILIIGNVEKIKLNFFRNKNSTTD